MSTHRRAGEVEVLHRDEHFLVVNKPAFLPTTSPGPGDTLVERVRALDAGASKHHPSSRLDAEVTGVVIFARNAQAIQHLLAARREGSYQRDYVALAGATPVPREGEWRGAIALDARDPRKRSVATRAEKTAREACTRYRTLDALPNAALLLLEPRTGRTHQLRVHAAHAGCPLLGDRAYGGPARLVLADGSVIAPRRAMLHCARVVVPNPAGGPPLCMRAEPPSDMQQIWQTLGGSAIELR